MNYAMPWFEIPLSDIERATRFYGSLFDYEFEIMDAMGMKTAFFPIDHQNGKTGGSLTQGPPYIPGKGGGIVYLQAHESIGEALSRVTKAGGEVLLPQVKIPDGFMAHFLDSEGNCVGVFAPKA